MRYDDFGWRKICLAFLFCIFFREGNCEEHNFYDGMKGVRSLLIWILKRVV